MNIFATDLDRSLIFSSKFISFDMNPICVERNSEKEISYMLEDSLKLLGDIKREQGLFLIPITTRSVDQYKRIDCVQDSTYAITTNGGIILHNGKKYDKWDNIVQSILMKYSRYFDDIPHIVQDFSYMFEKELRCVDNIFYYIKLIDNQKDINKFLDYLEKTLDKNIWSFTLQGLKLYIIPKDITKENALKFLASELNCNKLITCGDGKLDKDFLSIGDIAYIPNGSEILEYIELTDKTVLVPNGLYGTATLLKNVLKYHRKNS